jgi:predicted metal-dependent peptidase
MTQTTNVIEGISDYDLQRALDRTKSKAFIHKKNGAFLGPLLVSLEFQWDRSIPTACTNGAWIKWNPDWFVSLVPDARVTVLLHELWHIGLMHLLRLDSRNPKIWNYACDIVNNNKLEEEGYSFEGIEDCWKDRKYDGKCAEEIYDILISNPPPMGGSWGQDDLGDMHSPEPVDKQKLINNVAQAVQAAKLAGDPGTIPGEVESILDQFLQPKLRWEVLLDRFFQDFHKEDFTWSRPNRRYPDQYMPSMQSQNQLQDLNYYIDVSGSVTDAQIVRCNSEIKHIKDTYNPKKLRLILFDTRISAIYEYEEHESFEKLVVVGRGGTCLIPVRQHILKTKPSAAVIFSDLWVEPMEPVDIPVIWIAVSTTVDNVTCGTLIHIDE